MTTAGEVSDAAMMVHHALFSENVLVGVIVCVVFLTFMSCFSILSFSSGP